MTDIAIKSNGIQDKLLWAVVVALGAVSLGIVALTRGETVNAAWLVIAAVCVYFVAYRFYALFIAKTVLGINPARTTPAYRHNDGLDYVPTNRYVLFGTTSRRSPGRDRWSARCSRRRWATCPARCGSSPASSLRARCRT